MEKALIWSSWILGAYLIGSIPFGYLIGRMRGVDVRTVGSKNIGATNVYRTVGHKWGFLAFFCDFLKGFLPAFLALRLASSVNENLPICVGLACVIGHTLTVFMKFKGGKGVATAFGMMVALALHFARFDAGGGDARRPRVVLPRPAGDARHRGADRRVRHLQAQVEHRQACPRVREQDLLAEG